MPVPHDVVVLVGSLRRGSYNRKLANALPSLAPESMHLEIVELGNLSLYDADLEDAAPAEWTAFRRRVRVSDAVLFVTPEYNRSVPGGLKNAIDVGSRPLASNAWDAKPGAIISASPGAIGGFGANNHLRQSLVSVNVTAMAAPEAYIGRVDKLFDDQGTLTNESTREFLGKFLGSFSAFITRHQLR
jgi:chromate reductase, NAD(P)H dehydrogenase (quinone)